MGFSVIINKCCLFVYRGPARSGGRQGWLGPNPRLCNAGCEGGEGEAAFHAQKPLVAPAMEGVKENYFPIFNIGKG